MSSSAAHHASGLRRVLVASDLTPGALRGVRRAALLPYTRGARVDVLCVGAANERAGADSAQRLQHDLDEQAAILRAALHDRGARVEVSAAIVRGEPFVELVRASRARDVDLLVLGRASAGSAERLGSTAERVVRHGSRPVLVVRNEPHLPYREAIVAVDLSDVSPVVLRLRELVLEPRAAVRLVHGYQLGFQELLAVSLPRAAVETWRAEVAKQARASLDALLETLGDRAAQLDVVLAESEPRALVLGEIRRRRADLVVLGTHGRTGISHLMLGSVAESVLRDAPCDVLIGRPERFSYEDP